jgi:hypothetical protein
MDTTEVLEILGMVNDLENISKVEITLGETPSIIIEKVVGAIEEKALPKEAEAPTKNELETFGGFGAAKAYSPSPTGNLASEGQRKYADDLAKKLGGSDMMNIVYGLAQVLEVPADEILHPDLWLEQLTRDQANSYLDILEQQYKKQSRGGFQ